MAKRDWSNAELARTLARIGVMLELDGEVMVFTGGLESMPRPDAQRLAERHGARIAGSISKKVTLVVAGPGAGSKLDDARRLGIPVIDERAFLKRVGAA